MYKGSAPGSLMLLGEHAVLWDKRAVVCAVDKRIQVTLTPRNDRNIIIHSLLGTLQTPIDALDSVAVQKPFQFVLATIQQVKSQLLSGFTLSITSEFSHTIGFGSSAAVVVATLAVFVQWIPSIAETEAKEAWIFQTAKKIIKTVQGVGSGADVAASVFGGILFYQQQAPFVLEKVSCMPPLVAIYSGYKTPTPEVIQIVEEKRKQKPLIYEKLFEAIDQCVEASTVAFHKQDWSFLGSLFNIQQGLMDAIGVSTPALNQLIDTLRKEPTIYGAKISGSGLGDCIIGVGEGKPEGLSTISVNTSFAGICYG